MLSGRTQKERKPRMIQIPEKTIPAFHSQTILSLNNRKILTAKSSQTILQLNQNPYTSPASFAVSYKHPTLQHTVQKGQKASLFTSSVSLSIDALLGWNVKNPACDVDVSAFLLGADQKVPGDSWFVFYGQPQSPDKSVSFETISANQCEKIHIQLNQLNPVVQKIVFVLTINEALTHNLNFSMIDNAYIQIVDSNHQELVSFPMSDYYESVTSMMIGEIYLHNGIWKFNAVGNGVKEDLAGLCKRYGVNVS